MSEQTTTRLGRARERAAGAKRLLVATAAAGFVVALLLGRASHPAHAKASSGDTSSTAVTTSNDDGLDDFGLDAGGSSIGPSGGAAPQVQSSVS